MRNVNHELKFDQKFRENLRVNRNLYTNRYIYRIIIMMLVYKGVHKSDVSINSILTYLPTSYFVSACSSKYVEIIPYHYLQALSDAFSKICVKLSTQLYNIT